MYMAIATRLSCDETFNDGFVVRFLPSLDVKELLPARRYAECGISCHRVSVS